MMTPEVYLKSRQFICKAGEVVTMEDALYAVMMARGQSLCSKFEPIKGVSRMQVKDLSHMSEQEADNYIASLGALGYDTMVLRNEYKQTKHITL